MTFDINGYEVTATDLGYSFQYGRGTIHINDLSTVRQVTSDLGACVPDEVVTPV